MAMAVLQGLKHKYPGLEGDETGKHGDMFKDKETGLFTICFTDSKRKRYKATMEKFSLQSSMWLHLVQEKLQQLAFMFKRKSVLREGLP